MGLIAAVFMEIAMMRHVLGLPPSYKVVTDEWLLFLVAVQSGHWMQAKNRHWFAWLVKRLWDWLRSAWGASCVLGAVVFVFLFFEAFHDVARLGFAVIGGFVISNFIYDDLKPTPPETNNVQVSIKVDRAMKRAVEGHMMWSLVWAVAGAILATWIVVRVVLDGVMADVLGAIQEEASLVWKLPLLLGFAVAALVRFYIWLEWEKFGENFGHMNEDE